MNNEELKLSRYNSAMPQLLRIDNIWQKTHDSAVAISYSEWNEWLDRIWMEFEDDAGEEIKESIKKINEKLSKIALYGLNPKIAKKNPLLYSKVIITQKNYLMEKEIILRALQNTSGKGTAYQEDLKDYMD